MPKQPELGRPEPTDEDYESLRRASENPVHPFTMARLQALGWVERAKPGAYLAACFGWSMVRHESTEAGVDALREAWRRHREAEARKTLRHTTQVL